MLARSSAALSANGIDAQTGARSESADRTASTCSGVDGAASGGALTGSWHGSGAGRRAGVSVAMAEEAAPIGAWRAPPMARQMGVAIRRGWEREGRRRKRSSQKEEKCFSVEIFLRLSSTSPTSSLSLCAERFPAEGGRELPLPLERARELESVSEPWS